MISIPEVLELLEVEPPARLPGHITCTAHDESTPSMWISEDRFWAFCCGTGGDCIDLVRFITGATFGQAKRFLEGVMDVEYVRPVRVERELFDFSDLVMVETLKRQGEEEAMEFIASRWPYLSLDWLRLTFGVFSTRWALWIPHTDDDGLVRGVKTRSYATGDKKSITNSCITSRLYRGKQLGGDAGKAILCEGESDTWTMTKHFEGDPYITVYGLPAGAKTWKEVFAQELVSKHRHVDLWLDPDRTGRQAAAHILEDLMPRGIAVEDCVVPIDYEDVSAAYADGWVPGVG